LDKHDTFQELLAQLPAELRTSIDHVAKLGAQGMLAAALEAEVDEYLARHRDQRDEGGRALVVRNGKARPRTVAFGSGAVPVTGLRVQEPRLRYRAWALAYHAFSDPLKELSMIPRSRGIHRPGR